MTIHLTLTTSRFRPLELEPTDNEVDDITSLCSEFEVADEKDGLALIPARFKPCPEGACKGDPGKTKDRCLESGGGLHRLSVNVTEMTCLGADLDDISNDAFGRVLGALRARGLMFWAWETFNHVPNSGLTRARILIPFTEPLPIAHYRQWSQVAWPALIRDIGLHGVARADNACRDAARIYYTPRKPSEESPHEAAFSPGAAYDWRPVLGDALATIPVADEVPEPLEEDPERPVDLQRIRSQLERIRVGQEPGGLAWMLKRVLAGEAPTEPPNQRDAALPSRYKAWLSITAAVANAAEGWESREALFEIIRDAHAAEIAASPEDHTKHETLLGLLHTALEDAPAYKAQREAERKAKMECQRKILKRMLDRIMPPDKPSEPPDEPVGPKVPSDSAEAADDSTLAAEPEGDWKDGLLWVTQKNGDQKLQNCSANLEHFLRCSPEWKGVLRFNAVTQKIEMHGGPLGSGVTPFTDELVALIADWFQRLPDELALRLGDGVVLSRIRSVAAQNSYDPIRDYLLGLRWNGGNRVDTALERYFNASTIDSDGQDITEYVRVISRRWAISAVARGLVPGCKVDTVLILEGLKQGEKKTTGFETLGGEWYTGQHVDLHDRDSWALIAQHWIVELGELETFRKSEVTAQKAFFSLRVDKFRKAYGYQVQDYPRRCVFVGSTNNTDYLKDETGNRRYWPIRCGQANVPLLRRERDQFWAEAVSLFLNGGKGKCAKCDADVEDRCVDHRWWLTADEHDLLLQHQTEERMAQDPFTEKIQVRLLEKPVDKRPREMTLLEVMNLIDCDITKGQERRVGAALRRLGFTKVQRRVGNERRNVWAVPASLLEAPRTDYSEQKTTQPNMAKANA